MRRTGFIMRQLGIGLLVCVVGCAAQPGDGITSGEAGRALGGLENSQPFFGQLKAIEPSEDPVGEFALALCGCKCWRVVIAPEEGAAPTQVLVHFSRKGANNPASEVTVYGEKDGITVSGTVDQRTGYTEGRIQTSTGEMLFAANRSGKFTDKLNTCVLCHFGEVPIQPLEPEHPSVETDPPSCMTCHALE